VTARALRAAASSVFERWVILEAHCLLHFTSKTEDADRLEALGFYALVKRRPSPSAGPPALRLGTNAKIASAPGETVAAVGPTQGGGSALLRRFALQAGARELLRPVRLAGEQIWSGKRQAGKMHRTCHCLRRQVDLAEGVAVLRLPETGSARFGNVQTCGSSWACPVCASRISEERRGELRRGLAAARSQGLAVVLLTRTVSHYAFETQSAVVALLKDALARSCSGRAANALRARYGVVGSVRSVEVTWGKNGWHPHVHELLLLEPGYDLAALRADFAALWSRSVVLVGGRSLSEKHGLDAVDCNARIADYVAKWGKEPGWQEAEELSKTVVKMGKGRGQYTPLELLAAFTFEGNLMAGRLWLEYALAMKGSHQLRWSPLLKKRLGIVERSDAEIVEEKSADAVKLATIPVEEWRVILRKEERGRVLAVAAAGDVLALHVLLNQITGGTVEELREVERRQTAWRVRPLRRSALGLNVKPFIPVAPAPLSPVQVRSHAENLVSAAAYTEKLRRLGLLSVCYNAGPSARGGRVAVQRGAELLGAATLPGLSVGVLGSSEIGRKTHD
jgi:hypothetical protein